MSRRALATLITSLAVVMMLTAGALAGYPFYTDWRASNKQGTLSTKFKTAALKDSYRRHTLADGDPLTRIIIPKTGLDTVVVEGTSLAALAAGAGHYPSTPLPGEPGNVGIAGHRTMNGKPFANNDELVPGDKVILETPLGRYIYEVIPAFDGHANPWATEPNDWTVVAPTQTSMLTLTTCHPRGTARQRLVVRAKLVSSEPLA